MLTMKNLIRRHNTNENVKIKEPDLLIIITGGEMAYRRNDGIYLIPIGCLRE